MNPTQRKAVASSLSNLLEALQGNVTDAALWFKEHHVLTQSDCEQIEAWRFTARGPRVQADHLLSLLQVKDNSWNKLLEYLEAQHMGDLKTKLEKMNDCEQMGDANINSVTQLAKEKFRKLICMTQVMSYMDFKKIYHAKQTTDRTHQSTQATDEANDNEDDTQELLSDVIIDILSMYNAIPAGNSHCETSISGRGTASYIVIGIEYHPKDLVRMIASPLTERPDEAEYQTLARQITPNIDITYFEIAITKADVTNSKQLWPEWIKQGFYGLLEIVDGTTGPAYPCNKREATHLYSRIQGRNLLPNELSKSDIDKIYKKFLRNEEITPLSGLEYHLHRNENVQTFKILIANGKPDNLIEKDVKELWQSLGIIPWDIVFDLDEQSRVDGVYKSFVYRQKKQTFVTFPDDIKQLCENESMRLQTGQKVLYVLMRGEEEAGKPPLRDNKWKHNVGDALVSIFDMLRPHTPIMCFHAFSSRDHLYYFQQLHKLIMEKREAADATQNSAVTTIVCSISKTHLEEHYTGLSKEPKGSADVIEMVVAPVRQIHNCIAAIFGSHETAQYRFPGRGGETHLTQAEHRTIRDILTLYHATLGEEFLLLCKTREERNSFATKERFNFLRGNEITPSNLYIHEKMGKQTYVDRAEYEDIHQKAIILLRDISEKFIRSKNRINIKHERSAGGTTAGKVLLWKLHKEYPCVHLLNVPDMHDVYEALALLYTKAQLPLVILIDNKNISCDNLVSYLKNTPPGAGILVKALVVSVTDEKKGRAALDANCAYEKTILQQVNDQRNQEAFEELYKEAIKDEVQLQTFEQTIRNTCVRTVFLYGLAAFTHRYEKFRPRVEDVLSNLEPTQSKTLFVTSMVAHYTSQPLACELVAALLELKNEDFFNLEKNINQALGSAAELVQIVQSDYRNIQGTGVRPITAYVGDLIIEMDADSKANAKQGVIGKFLSLLREVFLKKYSSYGLALGYLIDRLFILRDDEEFGENDMHKLAKNIKENKKKKFSALVSEMSDVMSKVKAVEMFESIARSLPEGSQLNHFRGNTMARYLMYGKEADRKGALKQIRLALHVKEHDALLKTESTDATLLAIAGNLLRIDVSLEFKTKMAGVREGQSGYEPFRDHCFEYARRGFDVAITLLRSAQEMSRTNSHPYVTEAQIYVDYLTMHFENFCGSNPAEFTKRVNRSSTDELLFHGERRAITCLSKLEQLMAQEPLQGYGYETTFKRMNEIQRRLFSLRVDKDKEQHLESIRNDCDSVTASCMVAFAMHTYNKKFHELDCSMLAKIFDVLNNRCQEDMTSSMYYYLVQCIILLNQPPMVHVRGNIDYLSTCCNEWAENGNDFRPHFYIAMLNLLTAINSTDARTRSAYFEYFDEEMGEIARFNSHEALEESNLYGRSPLRSGRSSMKYQQFRKSRFVIGEGQNVDALIPIHSRDLDDRIDKSRLRRFAGVVSDKRIFCKELNRSFHVTEPDMKHLPQKEKPRVEFYIQASYAGLLSYRPHSVEK